MSLCLPESTRWGALALSLVATGALAATGEDACIVDISGVAVELGQTSQAQCLAYGVSSLAGKTDISSRVVHFGSNTYRVSTSGTELSPDGGKTFIPTLTQSATPPQANSLTRLQAQASEIPQTLPAPAAPALPTAKAPAQTQAASKPAVTAGVTAAAAPAPARPAPSSPTVAATAPTTVTPAPKASTPTSPPAVAPTSSNAVVAASAPAARPVAPAATPLAACEYKKKDTWLKVPAPSAASCVEKVRAALGNSYDGNASAYWQGSYITIVGTQAYSSPDGKAWTLVTGN